MIRDKFIDGMSRAAASVVLVTTDGEHGRAGVTVSAMASVSADSASPSLLVCVHRLSPAAPAILANGVFCVNLLRDSQSWLSDTFAGRRSTQTGDKFEAGRWTTLQTGAPVLADGLVAFDCTLRMATLYGSHYILVGEVEEAVVAEHGPALVYANRAYGSPVAIGGAPSSRREAAAENDPLVDIAVFGCFSPLAPYTVPRLLAEFIDHHPNADVRVVEGDQAQLLRLLRTGEIAFALTYADGLPDDVEAQHLADVVPYVLLPALHPLAAQATVSLTALAAEPMVLLDVPPSREYFPSLFAELGLTPRIAYRSPSFEMVRSMVGNGLGYAILGTKPASSTTYDGRAVVARSITEPVAPSRLAVVTLRQARRTAEAAALIGLLRLRLGPEPAAARRRVGPTSW
jgi:flavin reductase (DIM6/NTAB) family NADH-FMN oxidoreductase RutF/DNA-binding transcriptional LysR family regulator